MGKENIWNEATNQSFEEEGEVNFLCNFITSFNFWWYFICYISRISSVTKLTEYFDFVYRSNKESETDLYAVISQRRSERKEQFDSMFSSLVSKYGGRGDASEPTEEEFEAAQKKLESRKSSKKSKRK